MGAIVSILGKVGTSIIMSLLTEAFLKALLIRAMEMYAQSTESKVDDKLVEDVKKALNK